MVQFYPSKNNPLTDKDKVDLTEEVKEELKKFVDEDIEEIKSWPASEIDELNKRNLALTTEAGKAAAEAEFYKRFEAADANCNDVLSIDEWYEFTEGYKVGREARREKFTEKNDEQLKQFWDIVDSNQVKESEEDHGVSMAEIEAAFLFCGDYIKENVPGLDSC